MAKIFFQSMEKFGLLDKIGGITVDNTAANNTFFVELEKLMHEEGHKFHQELVIE